MSELAQAQRVFFCGNCKRRTVFVYGGPLKDTDGHLWTCNVGCDYRIDSNTPPDSREPSSATEGER